MADEVRDIRYGGRRFIPVYSRRKDAPEKLGRFDSADQANPKHLTVVSYNCLSQERASAAEFPYARAAVLNWRNRRTKLLKEIASYGADILLMQDVDQYAEWWRPKLTAMGFDSLFMEASDRREAGVAIFFSRERLQLFRSEQVKLDDLCQELKSSLHHKARHGDVALIAGLQPWESSALPTAVCLCSGMLARGKSYKELRMWQAKYLARRIEMFNADFHVPVLWGLDAHSNPLSDVYHIITTGFMPRTILPPREPPRPDARIISMASIKVSWEHPDPGDAPIDHYRVERRAGRNRVVGYILFDRIKYPATSCLVTGLASGVSYEFRVIGVSSVGVGLPSPPSAPVTTPKIRENPAESRELDLLSVGSLGSVETRASEVVVGHTPTGHVARWADGNLHVKLPPTRHGEPLGPPCSSICSGGHTVLVHRCELESAYSNYAKYCPDAAARMDVRTSSWRTPRTMVHKKHTEEESKGDQGGVETKEDTATVAGGAGGAAEPEDGKADAAPEGVKRSDTDGEDGATGGDDDFASDDDSDDDTDSQATASDAASSTGVPETSYGAEGVGCREPPFTRRRPPEHEIDQLDRGVVGVTDSYLFYSRGELVMKAFLSLLTPEELHDLDDDANGEYLPNLLMASDHQALGAVFQFDEDKISSRW